MHLVTAVPGDPRRHKTSFTRALREALGFLSAREETSVSCQDVVYGLVYNGGFKL